MCDGTCVPLTYLCDGVKDCKDNGDEVNCNYFPELWFKGRSKFKSFLLIFRLFSKLLDLGGFRFSVLNL